MEQIKLQCLCSVEPKDVTGTSKIKTKLGKLLLVNGDSWWINILLKNLWSINLHMNDNKQFIIKKLVRNIPLMEM